eukprot:jgi/Picre1/31991/NNA_007339.t1
MRRVHIVLSVLLCFHSFFTAFGAVEHKRCGACKVVAGELRERLNREKNRVRNAIDSRARLDKDGKRYGKVIKFEVSELRAIELIDDLCNEMKKYHFSQGTWSANKSSSSDTAEVKYQRSYLVNVCSDIIGEWEDEISRDIREGKATAESVEELLCHNYSKSCHGLGGDNSKDEL